MISSLNIRTSRKSSAIRTDANDPTHFSATRRPRLEDYPLPKAPHLHKQEINFLSILSMTWRYKFFAAFIFFMTFAATVSTYFLVSPVYQASTILLVGQSNIDATLQDNIKMQLTARSQVQIAESIDVVKSALVDIGLDNVPVNPPTLFHGLGAKIRRLLLGVEETKGSATLVSNIDRIAAEMSSMVKVRAEPNSESLIISFKHRDAAFTASFTDALARAFVDRQLELLKRPGAVEFYQTQKRRFEDEVSKNSKLFDTFVRQESTYSMTDQLSLLLKRESELSSAISQTRGSIAERLGQKIGLVSQLKLLKPVTQSRYVLGLVDKLGEETANQNPPASNLTASSPGGDPPLLMVKVYQDAMVSLFKVNGELAGLRELAQQQEEELSKNKTELSQLKGNQAEYDRLKRNVDLAAYSVELFSKRAVDVQITEDLRDARLLTARVVQQAAMPLIPIFPDQKMFLSAGTIFGLLMAALFSVIRGRRRLKKLSSLELRPLSTQA
jgi:uncharacterized protein involved in exopolysaccharide biosynthesis